MGTVSVPLTKRLQEELDNLVQQGVAENRAAVMRKALDRLAEEEAIRVVLESEQELAEGKVLRGDLRKLIK